MQNIELNPEKCRRFQNRRRLPFALVVLLSVASCAAGELGYLPRGGPMGFRFLAVAKPAPAFVSPAAIVPPPPAPVLGPPAPPPAPEPPAAIETTVPAPAVTNQVSPVPFEQTRPEDVVSPQMLLKYFSKGTNGATSSVTVPLDFTPPPAR